MQSSPGKPLISATRLRRRVGELAREIRSHYKKRPPVVLGLMNGSLFFLVDLLRQLPRDYTVECWRVNSYQGYKSQNVLRGLESCHADVKGRDVLLIDDILDTGLTLSKIRDRVLRLGARRVDICVLLSKRKPRRRVVRAQWVGFPIDDEFVIGYGLDLDGHYRNLPDVRVLPGGE